jgi:excisionase family DNA binding protein
MNQNQGQLPLGPEPSGLVDMDWVATRLGVEARAVRRLMYDGKIAYVKVGAKVRFEPADVEHFIDDNRHPAVAPQPPHVSTVERDATMSANGHQAAGRIVESAGRPRVAKGSGRLLDGGDATAAIAPGGLDDRRANGRRPSPPR